MYCDAVKVTNIGVEASRHVESFTKKKRPLPVMAVTTRVSGPGPGTVALSVTPMVSVALVSSGMVLMVLVVDILYGFIDPRIRVGKSGA